MSGRYKFTREEIREKLEELGYQNIPADKLVQFAEDLEKLIEFEKARGTTSPGLSSNTSDSSYSDSYMHSEDQSLSTSQEVSTSQEGTREASQAFSHYRTALGTMRERPEPIRKFNSQKPSHEHYGKENFVHRPAKPKVSSTSAALPNEDERPATHQSVKRKVLRKKDGESRVFDESFTSSESVTDISDLEQRLRDLPLMQRDADDAISVTSDGSQEPQGYRPWEMYAGRAPPSYIRPATSHPHTRRLRKCDPVTRYHQFKSEWKHNKAPGENNHKNLRWNVRGKLLQCDVYERPQRVFAPNKYVVPTEKKRQALRWQVRTNLASQ